jgi:hypothetical protein
VNTAARWYLDVSGRRVGPYDWSVVLELAQFGTLARSDRLLNLERPAWKRVDEFPALVELINTADVSLARHSFWRSFGVLGGILWVLLAGTFWTFSILGWPGLLDGVLIARLQTLGAVLLIGVGAVIMRFLWAATRSADGSGVGVWRGALRVAGIGSLFLLTVTTVAVVINARELFAMARGTDPLGSAEILLLPGGSELEVRGILGVGVASQFARALAEHPQVRTIHLNSPGGREREGVVMANLIKSGRLGTYTATGCYSACVLAFVAGSPRVLNPDARLGLHSVSGDGTDPFYIARVNASYRQNLRTMGVSESFVRQATSAPASEVWIPEPAELLSNHVVDQVSDSGYAQSGETLAGLSPRAEGHEREFPFIRHLSLTDPRRFAPFDRSLRLALRRGADNFEIVRHASNLSAEIEAERLPLVADEAAVKYATSLRNAARSFRARDSSQCSAILEPDPRDEVGRSTAVLHALDHGLQLLLDAPVHGKPFSDDSDAKAFAKVVGAAGKAGVANTTSDCDRLLLLFDLALADKPAVAAGFLRALHIAHPTAVVGQ